MKGAFALFKQPSWAACAMEPIGTWSQSGHPTESEFLADRGYLDGGSLLTAV